MKTRKHVHTKPAPAFFIPREDLNDTSRALYGLAQTYEAEAAEYDRESVEDPLEDRAESDVYEWLNERRGWLDQ